MMYLFTESKDLTVHNLEIFFKMIYLFNESKDQLTVYYLQTFNNIIYIVNTLTYSFGINGPDYAC